MKQMTKDEFKELFWEIDNDELSKIISYGNSKNWKADEDIDLWIKRYYNIEIKKVTK